MEFITEDVQKELNLTPEQIQGLAPKFDEYIATQKKGWDGKANADADGIINGAIGKVVEVTNIARNQGEKVADYLQRASSEFLAGKKTELENAKADYDKKLKEFKGDEATKAELDKVKADYDAALKKYADYDDVKAKADQFDPLSQELTQLRRNTAFTSVKPNFPETVNAYEAKAKWSEFISATEEKYIIQFDKENVAVAVDKENPHRILKLSELVSKDETITLLTAGRQQGGTGAKQAEMKDITGVPFQIAKDATTADISKAINDHLDKEGISKTAPERADKFREMFNKIRAAK